MRFLLLPLLIISFRFVEAQKLIRGIYHAELLLNKEKNVVLPFTISIENDSLINFHNGEEKITVKEIKLIRDSFELKMPIFDSEFHFKKNGKELNGFWYNLSKSKPSIIPFYATKKVSYRFIHPKPLPNNFFAGRWESYFGSATIKTGNAIGVFQIKDSRAMGTFLTETGDYRYLEGITSGRVMYLSCFDGSHAFLFIARLNEKNEIEGDFYSGNSYHEKWSARKNENFNLKNANEITKVDQPDEKIDFKFKNTSGVNISLNDEKFKNKVVMIQLMGSWCPNCMDETNYFSELYNNYKDQGLEIIGICFERTEDTIKARKNIVRLKERFNVKYELLVSGLTGKDKASETFPMLSEISAFPTTIFLNKKKKIEKIHTGFSGPATGEEFIKYKIETNDLLQKLLKE